MAATEARNPSDASLKTQPDRIEIAREKLIVALDLPTLSQAKEMVATLGDEVVFYKVGLGLQISGGAQFVEYLKNLNKKIFLDYKYYDIPNTVENAVARAAELGVDFLTVHGVTEIMKSAVAGRRASAMKLLCVTVLTSMDSDDLVELGVKSDITVEDLVVRRAVKALEAGIDGVVASAHEVEAIKARTSHKLMVVTPGIRPENSATGDQKRIATPGKAIKSGADYLVVGRPIWEARNPRHAARDAIAEIAEALA